jgi:hypothetical protein
MDPPEVERGSQAIRGPDTDIEELVTQIAEVIDALGSHQPEIADGIGWLCFDSALCGLHSAVVALEELGVEHRHIPSCPVR